MKLSAGSHSEIEGEGAQSNVSYNPQNPVDTATEAEAVAEASAANAESEAPNQQIVTDITASITEHHESPEKPPGKVVEISVDVEMDADADRPQSSVSDSPAGRQLPRPPQQRLSAMNSEYNINSGYPAFCYPYANIYISLPRACLSLCVYLCTMFFRIRREARSNQFAVGPEPQIHRLCQRQLAHATLGFGRNDTHNEETPEPSGGPQQQQYRGEPVPGH